MPSLAPDCHDDQKITQAIAFYEWRGAAGDFQWVDQERLKQVREYLCEWDTVGYWQVIIQGGVRGYSLFHHEWVELKNYWSNGLDPLDQDQQVSGYYQMHSQGLLA
ncbi:MAG: hypothetical protein MN733_35800, partial [Nitrososphaera sp.]|nr:hypothetical protein [Nitrososphaera sp.]